jgi:chaperonin GroES
MAQQTAKKIALKPLGNRVVAKRQEQAETLKGGILLPDSAKKKQETAEVVAVGTGTKTGSDHRRRGVRHRQSGRHHCYY